MEKEREGERRELSLPTVKFILVTCMEPSSLAVLLLPSSLCSNKR